MEKFPHLFTFLEDQYISLEKLAHLANEDFYDHFHLPLSIIAAQEFTEFLPIIQSVSNNQDDKDRWSIQGKNTYSCKKTYLALSPNDDAPVPSKWIWKSRALPKNHFFFCLLLYDRLNTRDLLTRKHFYVESTSCVYASYAPIKQ